MRGTPTSAATPAIRRARRRARASEIAATAVGRYGSGFPLCVRHCGFASARLLAPLGGVDRGVLLATQRFARELDQVVRGESHAEHRLDLPLLERELRRLPELGAIVRLPADLAGDVPGERGAELQARQVEPAACRRMQPVGIGRVDL